MSLQRAHKQEDVEDVILEVLEPGHARTTQEIYAAVRRRLNLTPDDLERANKRDESKINQIIANALQGKRRLCRNGLIVRTGVGEFRITEAGCTYLDKHRASVAEGLKLLDGMFLDTSRD
ncbi:winged helix-turn-helix domain-containing protein [Aurantiacibacter rhizosphaerae]|uniref:Restriction system protein Mrr-like N-terminal domain-containing protein n=1 Tax=Aurantiacibacter rhizosphaerae TaxID=2691582 RepID=A0A844XAH3_9SPHN|nr:winged helix-turn-helix domain-containing protein [Aurantiacibacter rhizosphaerae]MWV27471.1 hypothetical protein [Aurantiacibacter rhizosphaerae]